jgi:hypothetical protein
MNLSPGVLYYPIVTGQPYLVLSHGLVIVEGIPGAPFATYYHSPLRYPLELSHGDYFCPQCTTHLTVMD